MPGTFEVPGIYTYTPDFCFLNNNGPTRSMIQPKASSAHGTTCSQPGTYMTRRGRSINFQMRQAT
jgi:hypothetical protein